MTAPLVVSDLVGIRRADGSRSFSPTTVSSAPLAGRALDEATRSGVAVTGAELFSSD